MCSQESCDRFHVREATPPCMGWEFGLSWREKLILVTEVSSELCTFAATPGCQAYYLRIINFSAQSIMRETTAVLMERVLT